MRIQIHSDSKNINLVLPSWMVFSDLTAAIAAKVIRKHDKDEKDDGYLPSRRDLCRIMRELRKYKRKYGHLDLVDVQSADGDIVKIVL
ncbi:MAG: hypothetical protein WCY62_04785 [Clostridia bacterium]